VRRWAEFILNHRRWVLGFWGFVLLLGIALAAQTTKRLTVDFSLPGQPGSETAKKIEHAFSSGGDSPPYLVTVTMPQGQTITGHEAQISEAFDAIAASGPGVRVIDEANTGDTAFRTKDDRTAYAYVFRHLDKSPDQKLPTTQFRTALQKAAPAGAVVGVTGEDPLATGGDNNSGPNVLGETLIGGVLALGVLAFVFASLLALLPLVVAAVSILASFLLLLPLTYIMDVSYVVEFLVALIGLGVAIDYSLLFVTRWREERDHGRDNHEAVVVAMETAGHAVLFSGLTVAIGLLALIVLPVPFMRSMGIGAALIPAASVAATLSLTPAILGGIGPRVDWPKIRHESRASRGWSRWAAGVVKHRWLAAGTALAALVALVCAFLGIKIGQASSDSLAHHGNAYDTLQLLERGGVPTGALTPMEVLVSTPQAPAVASALGKVDGVKKAFAPSGPAANREGTSIVLVVPHQETVNSKSVGTVKRVKNATRALPGVVGVAGTGPTQIDFMHAVYGNFPLMLTLIALLTFVLLARAFRSVLLPLKAVLLNLVSLAATLGLMVIFWQHGVGSNAIFGIHATGAITFYIPLLVFAFLFGLSMDYEVFILSRIREESDGARTTDAAVIEGMARTGRLVTSAALILFFAFAALASGPQTDLKILATGLGFGILLDATIVRSLLVPSLVSLFGRWNWWLPHRLARLLRVRPSHPHPEPRQPLPAKATASTR
jgi:putative drug exporter of the RND superfamily